MPLPKLKLQLLSRMKRALEKARRLSLSWNTLPAVKCMLLLGKVKSSTWRNANTPTKPRVSPSFDFARSARTEHAWKKKTPQRTSRITQLETNPGDSQRSSSKPATRILEQIIEVATCTSTKRERCSTVERKTTGTTHD